MGEFIDWMLSLSGQVEDWILVVADAWWVYLVIYGLSALDGFFPTAPSESTIVSLSSLWSSSGRPYLLLIGLAAWVGAWTGDNIGYWLGSKIGWERFRFLREGKGRTAVEAAERGLQRRALLFLMTARYIPFGRTAVNLVAGAVHFPHAKFWPRSLLSTFVWAVYSCAIGAIAGAWFGEHNLLAITVALVAAVVLALIAERVINAVHRTLDRRAEARGEIVPDRDEDEPLSGPEGPTAQAAHAAAAQDSQDSASQVPQDSASQVPLDSTGPRASGTPELADPEPVTAQGQDSPA
ncbi:MAG: DedA family protein [Brachybacterium alimentarium]